MNGPNISNQFRSLILDSDQFPIPSAFCMNKKKVKAIVLGCDPTNFSKDGSTQILATVFGIGTGDYRYFIDVLKNLKQVGLDLENIYVQNIIPYYMSKRTTENPLWDKIAEETLPYLIQELDSFDKGKNIPVFMTSETIYKFLLLSKSNYHKPRDLYNIPSLLPVQKKQNKLGRKLFPLYRHYHYRLNSDRFIDYKNLLKNILT